MVNFLKVVIKIAFTYKKIDNLSFKQFVEPMPVIYFVYYFLKRIFEFMLVEKFKMVKKLLIIVNIIQG